MININILTESEHRELFLYMLDKNRYPESEYHIVENSEEDILWDLVVVYEGIHRLHNVRCRKGGLVFISGEPPMSRVYAPPFLKQFDTLITQHPNLKHPNNIQWQPCMNWHVGVDYSQNFKSIFTFNEMAALEPMSKTKNISMITSALRMMPGHNRRMNFVEVLKKRLGDKVDLYGRGIRPINTKYEALKDYRFAICIENSNIPHYWTEKFADPILSYTVPIYFGCTNINDYFDHRSYISIDINDISGALNTLQAILDNPEKVYQEHLPFVKEARKKILTEYSIFPTLMSMFALHLEQKTEPVEVTLRPASSYWMQKWLHYKLRLTRLLYKIKIGGKESVSNYSTETEVKESDRYEGNHSFPLKLSIVVPVYNVEKYVKRCLESILTQDVDPSLYEVIVINDGSTDNSLAVVNETVASFTNVSVQSFENSGQSAARNRGTLSARGQYIWYIDSDDWIEPHSLRTLLPYMDGKNDIIQFGKSHVFADGTKKLFHCKPMIGSGRDVLLHGNWSIGAQFKFKEGIYHEDNDFTPRVLYNADKVISLDYPFYNHYQGNAMSTMHKPNIKKCYDLLTVSKLHVNYAMKLDDKEASKFFIDLASLELNTSLNNLRIYAKQDQDNYIMKVETEKKGYVIHPLKSSKLRYRMMALCILLTSVRTHFYLLHLRKTWSQYKAFLNLV